MRKTRAPVSGRAASLCYPADWPRRGVARSCPRTAGTPATTSQARRWEAHAAYPGTEVRADLEVRSQREGHRLDQGAGGTALSADIGADGALEDPPARPPFPPRPAQAGGAPAKASDIHAEARSGGLSRPHQRARPAPLGARPLATEDGPDWRGR